MCGIAGIYSFKKNKDHKDDLNTMVSAVRHRGPDSDGFYYDVEDGIYLGQQRLRVIDLNPRADQPMFSADRTVCIVFNGEIYNHNDLRRDLEQKGHDYFSTSDTESILYGYLEYGTEIFRMLDGVFAIAIWDFKKERLILARDRLGLKPLYYLRTNEAFYFASEVKAFKDLEAVGWEKKINREGIQTLLGFQYYFDPEKTLLEGVKKVSPGSYTEIDSAKVFSHRYWTLPNSKSFVSYEEALSKTEELLVSAIKKRVLNCDVPQGVLLSGGLDSSTIAAIAARLSGKERVKTFTAISNSEMDERGYADLVAKHIGSEHTQVEIKHPNILEDIDEIIKTYDDLNSVDPGVVSVRLLAEQMRKQGITVVLVGDGADEVFGGYSWYGLSKFPFNLVPSYLRSSAFYYILSRRMSNPVFNKYRSLLHNELNKYEGDIFAKISQFELLDQLPNHFNMKVDKANMSFGVEPRAPYLDYRLVEYVHQLPGDYKLDGWYFNYWRSWEKKILRDISKKYLPLDICIRKKHGFLLSMIDTMNANMGYVENRILKNKGIILSLVSEKYLMWLFSKSRNRFSAKEKEFMTWKIFLFSVWCDYFGFS